MKKTFPLYTLALTFLIGFSTTLPANAQRHEGRRAGHAMEEKLDLSEVQQEQFKTLHLEQREAARTWMETHPDASREDIKAHREELRILTQAAIANVLTAEQQQKLEEIKAQRPDRRHGKRGQQRHRRAHRRHGLMHKLDLSDAQQDQIKALRAEQHDVVKAWHEANPNATREQRQAHRKQQAEGHRAAIEALLTPDQRQMLKDMKAERSEHRGHRGKK